MTNTGYKADRKAIYEAVKKWKNSPFFRADALQMEGSPISLAPWLYDTEISESTTQIATRWANEADAHDGPSFEDVALAATEDDVVEVLTFLATENESELVSAVLGLLEENEGQTLYIGRASDASAFAIRLSEGQFQLAQMELDSALLDEGLISMNVLALGAHDAYAPLIPGFAPLEQKLYEMLHASELLTATLNEDASEISEVVAEFSSALASVIVEMMADEGTLKEKEVNLVYETFLGAYTGIFEEASKYVS